MQGYRTFLVAAATLAAGVFARWGLKIDPGVVADTAIIVIPAVMALMRTISHTSPGTKG